MAKNRQRRGRAVNGILVLDKPSAESSNRSLQKAKRLYFAQKAGHTGTLDPLATGVLPLCFGEATKFSQFILDSDKAYCSTFKLGEITASGDADGEILERRDASGITEQDVLTALVNFEGDIQQVPSMYSALKHQGQPLYKLARQGVEVERKSRNVTVYELECRAFRSGEETGAQPEVDVYVHCSKGTYVRSIAEDLGLALGCGAHVTALRRVKAGPFDDSQVVSFDTLELIGQSEGYSQLDKLLQPVDSALLHIPSVEIGEAAEFYLLRGNPVQVAQAPTEGIVRLYSQTGQLLGIGEILDDGRVGPKRLIATN